MKKRIASAMMLMLGFGLGLAAFASANPFDRPADSYGTAVNDVFQQIGSDLRLKLDRCSAKPDLRCRFSSQRLAVVVQGQETPPQIDRIIIAADLLQDHPATMPDLVVSEALIALGATMITFDPGLQQERRDALIVALAEAVHKTGEGRGSGAAADYAVALQQAATSLLVIIVTPKNFESAPQNNP